MPGDIAFTNPEGMAAPGGHYSHAVAANGFVYVSGQLPIARDGTKLADASFEQQAEQVLNNVDAALTAAGNAIYAKWIGSSRPARAVVPVPELHYGFKIEIEAVALAGKAG